MKNSQTFAAGLYIVATPIGNLADITFRAIEILKQADLIACEDTRVSGKLLSTFGIHTPTLSYHDHNADKQRPVLMDALQAGKKVALISDAGTPLISDPGYKLVKDAATFGIAVIPIPGVSSVTTALSVSGLPTDRFLFLGFLPNKTSARKHMLHAFANVDATLVMLESVHRLDDALQDMLICLGDREAVIARELTKLHEELRRDTLSALHAHYAKEGNPKGEVVIVIAPPTPSLPDKKDVDTLLIEALKTMSVKDAAAYVAQATGATKQDVYRKALALKS